MRPSPAAVLGWRLAWSRDPRQRWRQIGVVFVAAVAAALGVGGAGIVAAAAHADAVRHARLPLFAASDTPPALQVMPGALVVDGDQLPVVWLQPGRRAGR